MDSPEPFDTDAPPTSLHPIIRRNPVDPREVEMVAARWGSNPRFSGGASYRFVRSEGAVFPRHRCLIPASEFRMTVRGRNYRVRLEDGNHFYLAGTWEPAMAGWPLAFRVLTVAASAEVAHYQDRHGALILRRQVMQWLDHQVPEADLLGTPPARTFVVDELCAGQRALAL